MRYNKNENENQNSSEGCRDKSNWKNNFSFISTREQFVMKNNKRMQHLESEIFINRREKNKKINKNK